MLRGSKKYHKSENSIFRLNSILVHTPWKLSFKELPQNIAEASPEREKEGDDFGLFQLRKEKTQRPNSPITVSTQGPVHRGVGFTSVDCTSVEVQGLQSTTSVFQTWLTAIFNMINFPEWQPEEHPGENITNSYFPLKCQLDSGTNADTTSFSVLDGRAVSNLREVHNHPVTHQHHISQWCLLWPSYLNLQPADLPYLSLLYTPNPPTRCYFFRIYCVTLSILYAYNHLLCLFLFPSVKR